MIVLGIETSCDETAVAVVDDARRILAHNVLSQLEDHLPYGGVVPEIAARAHLEHLDHLVAKTMEEAGVDYEALDAVAATAGPGLIGGVMVGLMTAKAIAMAADKPLIAVNHLEAHALTVRLTDDVPVPFLLLLVSGGHCQLLRVQDVGEYELLGQTIDDAVGEAFDKVAKMMGLPYPGGPEMEKLLAGADAYAAAKIDLPRPMRGRKNADFSFAGLKTAVRQLICERVLSDQDKADLSLAFHQAVAEILVDRLEQGLKHMNCDGIDTLVVAGGVAANQYLCDKLKTFCTQQNLRFVSPPVKLCTDNAAMIAWAGIEKLRRGEINDMNVAARPRWPLYKEMV
ncbi:MAG: tsaD [Alphaproteobacteria bacterium]|nr:tsaD [Alphaproteobacteria bacterium]